MLHIFIIHDKCVWQTGDRSRAVQCVAWSHTTSCFCARDAESNRKVIVDNYLLVT